MGQGCNGLSERAARARRAAGWGAHSAAAWGEGPVSAAMTLRRGRSAVQTTLHTGRKAERRGTKSTTAGAEHPQVKACERLDMPAR
jgi:hypothetical protein